MIQLGLVLLIATPVVRVAFSVLGFAEEHDRMYVGFTLIVLAVLLYSVIGLRTDVLSLIRGRPGARRVPDVLFSIAGEISATMNMSDMPSASNSHSAPALHTLRDYFEISLYFMVLMASGTLASTGALDFPPCFIVLAALLFRGYLLRVRAVCSSRRLDQLPHPRLRGLLSG